MDYLKEYTVHCTPVNLRKGSSKSDNALFKGVHCTLYTCESDNALFNGVHCTPVHLRKGRSLIMGATGKQSRGFCLIGRAIKRWLISN